MTFDDELQELHCDSLCDPQCWQEKADHLKQVSSLLRPKVQEYWSAPIDNRDDKEHFVSMRLMICACAIENLLKGILIAENQEEVKSEIHSTGRLPKRFATHNLRRLAKMANVRFVPEENTELLDRLARAAEWHAKYPAPLVPHRIPAAHTTFKGKQLIAWSLHSSEDVTNIDRAISTLTSDGVKTDGNGRFENG